ncbi:MAG: recombinase family protein, partial [Kiritimatiellia bacterium]|nr:recombinase family protein [Kiritimatiellia bacterium]
MTTDTCDNSRTVKRQEIEERILSGLKDKLMAPELIEEFIREFQVEANRLAAEQETMSSSLTKELGG